jgi:2-polyprenyl-3-methyl-5-hydroxy-6-metoxy-1,4-benzoquinol methylase
MYGDPETYFEGHDEATKVEAQGTIVAEILRRTGMSNPSILDVGSGRGELLEAARRAGIEDAVGLELSSAMAGYAIERFHADVRRELVEEHARTAGRTYDAVVASAVLEHVHDPDSMIAAIGALTRPGAVLYLDLPNEPNLLTLVGGAVKRVGGSRTVYNLSPTFSPFHVFGFNRRALTALLTKHGFAPEAFFVWADPHIPARSGRADRAKALLATQVRRLANRTGTASNMCVWARRLAREASPQARL